MPGGVPSTQWQTQKSDLSLQSQNVSSLYRPMDRLDTMGQADMQQCAPVHRTIGSSIRLTVWASANPFYGQYDSDIFGSGSGGDMCL